MCQNITPLFDFEPPASEDEIRAASLQFVRKISGFTKPLQPTMLLPSTAEAICTRARNTRHFAN